jgi:hypothetical protein
LSRPLSLAAKQSLFAQETDVVWLVLLTIEHSDWATPIRIVNNYEDITSRGNLFLGCPFMVDFPEDSEDRPPQVSLQIDNVDRSIMLELRALESNPTITLELITSANYDTVEIGPMEFSVKTVEYDALKITGSLSYEPVLYESYPSGRFTPGDWPGLF